MSLRHDLARFLRAVAEILDPLPFAAIVVDLRDSIERERVDQADLAAHIAVIARNN